MICEIMRNLVVDGNKCTFELHTDTAFPNALRRALRSDVERYAPATITIRDNTSSQTDEYIAHRIGMIPFVPVDGTKDPDEELRLEVKDREATSYDLTGSSFKAVHDIPIVILTGKQCIDLSIRFARGRGRDHAKFSLIGPVAYSLDGKKASMGFHTITNECPLAYLLDALYELKKTINAAQYFVETEYDSVRRVVTNEKK